MTKDQLIQTLEGHRAETAAGLEAINRALAALEASPVASTVVKHPKGPIVYGNGHGGHRMRTPGVSPQGDVKEALYSILKSRSKGLTRKGMEEALTARNLKYNEHTVHNALRKLGVQVNKGGTGTPKIYSLAENKPKAKRPYYGGGSALKGVTKGKILEILKGSSEGLTLEAIQKLLADQGMMRSTSAIYGAMRKEAGIKRLPNPANPQSRLYAL